VTGWVCVGPPTVAVPAIVGWLSGPPPVAGASSEPPPQPAIVITAAAASPRSIALVVQVPIAIPSCAIHDPIRRVSSEGRLGIGA
jgi:hypothetical protein